MVDLRKMSGRVETGKCAGSSSVTQIFPPCSHSHPLATAGCAQQCGREINAWVLMADHTRLKDVPVTRHHRCIYSRAKILWYVIISFSRLIRVTCIWLGIEEPRGFFISKQNGKQTGFLIQEGLSRGKWLKTLIIQQVNGLRAQEQAVCQHI